MGPIKRATELFQGYALGLSAITDVAALEAYETRILEDARLTRNQRDALMALGYAIDKRLRPDHPVYRVGN